MWLFLYIQSPCVGCPYSKILTTLGRVLPRPLSFGHSHMLYDYTSKGFGT